MYYLQSDMSGLIGSMWPILLMFVVIYFFMIRPQVKKNKEQQDFVRAMNKGDEVVTSSGIIGRINQIDDQIVKLQIDGKNYIRVLKSSISREMTEALRKLPQQSE